MQILIINLTRMGDLVQTIGLISNLQSLYPKSKIDLLVMKSFSTIVNHFPYLHDLITIDEEFFGKNIAQNYWRGLSELHDLITSLNVRKYDVIINPIVSTQSALLTKLIQAEQKLGIQFTEKREQKMTCDFAAYQLANQHQLGDFSFNLVDIFAGMAWEIAKTTACLPRKDRVFHDFRLKIFEEDQICVHSFTKKITEPRLPIIAFHIGASQSNKVWDINNYHQTMKRLLETKKFTVVLLGGYNEIYFKDFFTDINSDLFFNTIGQFPLNQLLVVLNSIDLLVTNDTGPMHLATALGKPIIDISLGPVSKWETGAYSNQVLVIEANLTCYPCNFNHDCHHRQCQQVITPEIVLQAIDFMCHQKEFFLSHDSFSLLSRLRSAKNEKYELRPFTSVKFYIGGWDQFGFHTFRPYFQETITEKVFIFHCKRFIWSLYFRGLLEEFSDSNSSTLAIWQKFNAELHEDYYFPLLNFQYLQNDVQKLSSQITNIIGELQKVLPLKNQLDKKKEFLLCAKKKKDALLALAKNQDLIYDWFWFAIFQESEIDDYDLAKIAEKTIVIYKVLQKKLNILSRILILLNDKI